MAAHESLGPQFDVGDKVRVIVFDPSIGAHKKHMGVTHTVTDVTKSRVKVTGLTGTFSVGKRALTKVDP